MRKEHRSNRTNLNILWNLNILVRIIIYFAQPVTVCSETKSHRWTINIVLYWNTIPKAGIVLVLADFSKLSNTNTNKNSNSKNISGILVCYSINDLYKNNVNNKILHIFSNHLQKIHSELTNDQFFYFLSIKYIP